MTTRRSPILPPNYGKQEVKDAIGILENSPRWPRKTPVSSVPGFEGEVCREAGIVYFYSGGKWWYLQATELP